MPQRARVNFSVVRARPRLALAPNLSTAGEFTAPNLPQKGAGRVGHPLWDFRGNGQASAQTGSNSPQRAQRDTERVNAMEGN